MNQEMKQKIIGYLKACNTRKQMCFEGTKVVNKKEYNLGAINENTYRFFIDNRIEDATLTVREKDGCDVINCTLIDGFLNDANK